MTPDEDSALLPALKSLGFPQVASFSSSEAIGTGFADCVVEVPPSGAFELIVITNEGASELLSSPAFVLLVEEAPSVPAPPSFFG